MKEIRLTQGYVALVDDEDFDLLSGLKWQVEKQDRRNTQYARTSIRFDNGKWRSLRMHRLIMKLSDPSIVVDHIDGNGLNNSRSNLRATSQLENVKNVTKLNRRNKTGFRGVGREQIGGYVRYRSRIRVNNRLINLGSFQDPIDAAKAFNDAAKKHFGEFCGVLNEV